MYFLPEKAPFLARFWTFFLLWMDFLTCIGGDHLTGDFKFPKIGDLACRMEKMTIPLKNQAVVQYSQVDWAILASNRLEKSC